MFVGARVRSNQDGEYTFPFSLMRQTVNDTVHKYYVFKNTVHKHLFNILITKNEFLKEEKKATKRTKT